VIGELVRSRRRCFVQIANVYCGVMHIADGQSKVDIRRSEILPAREIGQHESKRVLEDVNSRLLRKKDGRHESDDSEAMESELRGGILFVAS
jgi:hypothetical protein